TCNCFALTILHSLHEPSTRRRRGRVYIDMYSRVRTLQSERVRHPSMQEAIQCLRLVRARCPVLCHQAYVAFRPTTSQRTRPASLKIRLCWVTSMRCHYLTTLLWAMDSILLVSISRRHNMRSSMTSFQSLTSISAREVCCMFAMRRVLKRARAILRTLADRFSQTPQTLLTRIALRRTWQSTGVFLQRQR